MLVFNFMPLIDYNVFPDDIVSQKMFPTPLELSISYVVITASNFNGSALSFSFKRSFFLARGVELYHTC